MSVIEDPGGATSSATAWARTRMACACDRSPTSPRTTARSVLPDENAAADSIGPVVSTTFSRTGASVTASRLASAETILGASPSSDPTAIDSVTGRSYQRYANRLAPAASTTSATTTTMRSQIGSFTSKFRKKTVDKCQAVRNPPTIAPTAAQITDGIVPGTLDPDQRQDV